MEEKNQYIFLPDLEKKIEEAVYDATNFFQKKCPYCDSLLYEGHMRNKIHWDHFIPIAKGGQHLPWNILPVCQKCNPKKNAKNPKLFLSEEINNKCEKYLIDVRDKYVGQIQIDLEKYAQIKSLFANFRSSSENKNDLTELTKSVFQIVTDKPYEEIRIFEKMPQSITNERDLLLQYFAKGNAHSSKLSTTEIVEEIKILTGKNANKNSVGKELTKLEFLKKSVRINKYQVATKWIVERINR